MGGRWVGQYMMMRDACCQVLVFGGGGEQINGPSWLFLPFSFSLLQDRGKRNRKGHETASECGMKTHTSSSFTIPPREQKECCLISFSPAFFCLTFSKKRVRIDRVFIGVVFLMVMVKRKERIVLSYSCIGVLVYRYTLDHIVPSKPAMDDVSGTVHGNSTVKVTN